jgi:hypothetical protein
MSIVNDANKWAKGRRDSDGATLSWTRDAWVLHVPGLGKSFTLPGTLSDDEAVAYVTAHHPPHACDLADYTRRRRRFAAHDLGDAIDRLEYEQDVAHIEEMERCIATIQEANVLLNQTTEYRWGLQMAKPPLPDEVVAGLDEAIRPVVVGMRLAGWETCDSGDGTSTLDCALGFPHVVVQIDRETYDTRPGCLRVCAWHAEEVAVKYGWTFIKADAQISTDLSEPVTILVHLARAS